MFLFILIYVIALSFFFPKWGHMFLNYQNFSFYKHLNEGHTKKYRKNSTFWETANFCIQSKSFFRDLLVQKCQFWFWREILMWSKDFIQQILKFWFFRILWPFKVVNFVKICKNIAIFEPNFHRINLFPPRKIDLESWNLAYM